MDIKDRFLEFITYKGLSKRKFQESIGVSNSYIQNISNGISAEVLHRIKEIYPELSTDWLITGKGDMLKPIQTVGDISNSTVSGVNVSGTEIHISSIDAYNTLLKIVETNQKATEKFQEQIDRLISIIENKL